MQYNSISYKNYEITIYIITLRKHWIFLPCNNQVNIVGAEKIIHMLGYFFYVCKI